MTTKGEASDAAVRKFLERLFITTPYRPSGMEPQLLIGELPSAWDIPLPHGARVVGAYVPMEFQTRVILDVPAPPEQAVAGIVQALTGAGWRSQEAGMGMRGGFVPSLRVPGIAGRMLCDDQRRRVLHVAAAPGEDGLTDMRLDLNSDPTAFTPCELDERMRAHDRMSVIPPLAAPPGMTQRGGGGGSGSGSVHSHAMLFGQLPIDEVERHYRQQLTAGGWVLQQYVASGRWAWNTWEFTDDRGVAWTGLLTVTAPRDQSGVYLLSVQAGAFRGMMSPGTRFEAGHPR